MTNLYGALKQIKIDKMIEDTFYIKIYPTLLPQHIKDAYDLNGQRSLVCYTLNAKIKMLSLDKAIFNQVLNRALPTTNINQLANMVEKAIESTLQKLFTTVEGYSVDGIFNEYMNLRGVKLVDGLPLNIENPLYAIQILDHTAKKEAVQNLSGKLPDDDKFTMEQIKLDNEALMRISFLLNLNLSQFRTNLYVDDLRLTAPNHFLLAERYIPHILSLAPFHKYKTLLEENGKSIQGKMDRNSERNKEEILEFCKQHLNKLPELYKELPNVTSKHLNEIDKYLVDEIWYSAFDRITVEDLYPHILKYDSIQKFTKESVEDYDGLNKYVYENTTIPKIAVHKVLDKNVKTKNVFSMNTFTKTLNPPIPSYIENNMKMFYTIDKIYANLGVELPREFKEDYLNYMETSLGYKPTKVADTKLPKNKRNDLLLEKMRRSYTILNYGDNKEILNNHNIRVKLPSYESNLECKVVFRDLDNKNFMIVFSPYKLTIADLQSKEVESRTDSEPLAVYIMEMNLKSWLSNLNLTGETKKVIYNFINKTYNSRFKNLSLK